MRSTKFRMAKNLTFRYTALISEQKDFKKNFRRESLLFKTYICDLSIKTLIFVSVQ